MVGEFTGEIIKSAIAKKLAAVISPVPNMLKEGMPQDFPLPAFFIRTVEVSQTKLLREQYTRTYQMNVRYHPLVNDLKKNEALEAMANKLMHFLSWIEVPIFLGNYDLEGDPIEETKAVVGQSMDYVITDGVLQLFVNYKVSGKIPPTTAAAMGQLDLNQTR